MAFQEVSTSSCGGRLVSSIGGALIGVLLFFVSFPVLFWNEGRAVHMAQDLEEGSKNVVSVDPPKVDPANDGKLIHITAKATTDETLADPDFGVKDKAIRLARKVEMYQYKEEAHTEKKKNLGGSETTVTTYTYPTVWSEEHYDSAAFKDPDFKGNNPPMPPYASKTWDAEKVTAGDFELSKSLIAMIRNEKPLPVGDKTGEAKPPERYKVAEGGFYKSVDAGGSSSSPAVGDVKVTYTVVEPETVSVIAVQTGKTFKPFHGSSGNDIELLEETDKDAAGMFKTAVENNNTLTWILHVVGFLMMAIGIFLVLNPLSVMGDVVPFIGNMVGALLAFIAALLAFGLSLVTISIGWVFYRPLIGIPLLLVGLAGIAGVVYLLIRWKKPAKSMA